MKSTGKRFEENFKKSVPKNIFYYRLRDGASSWGGNEKVRFQIENICDSIMYDGDYLYTLELKSTKGKSFPFSNIREHQITDLLWCSSFINVISGLIIDFSDLDECYFIEINNLKNYINNTVRKSIPIDYCKNNCLKIDVEKKRINKRYNVENFIKKAIDFI